MKKIGFILFLVFLIFACGKKELGNNGLKPQKGVVKLDIKYAWVPYGMSNGENHGIYKKLFYELSFDNEKFVLNFYKLDGEKVKSLNFPMGKGPGELFMPMSVFIENEKIYIYDGARKVVNIYSIDGKHIDDITLSSNIESFGNIAFYNGFLYFSGFSNDKLVKIDLKNNKIVKLLKYENGVNLKQSGIKKLIGKKIMMGTLAIDSKTGYVYLGRYCTPFSVEVYDKDLNKIMTIRRELPEKMKPFKFTKMGPAGDLVISSLKVDDKYLYVSFGGSQKVINGKFKPDEHIYYISVFDKKTGEFLYELKSDKFNKITGVATLLGVGDDYIAVRFTLSENQVKKIIKYNKNEESALNKRFGVGKMLVIFKKSF